MDTRAQPPDPPRRPAGRRAAVAAALAALAVLSAGAVRAQSTAELVDTRHNLSVSGPGPIKALTEDRICVFCHTPHNATPQSPLWNRQLEPETYNVYTSPTMNAAPQGQPTGATKLCLSCHDGTIALGTVVNPAGGIAVSGALPGVGSASGSGTLSNFGLDLSGHHPVAFPYVDALPDAELVSTPPQELVFGGDGEVHCTTCHDPHRDEFGRFLVKDNRNSALCVTCHQMPDWAASPHATSTLSVAGVLPRPPKTWPDWPTLGEWGCESCHTPHFAPTAEYLLNFTDITAVPFSCTSGGCHGGSADPPHPAAGTVTAPITIGLSPRTGRVDIARRIVKPSAHRPAPAELAAATGGRNAARTGMRAVVCADCHDPHALRDAPAEPPFVSGLLAGSPGVDRRGAELERASFEYEICLRCHGDDAGDPEFVPRAVASTNNRLDFDPANASIHPVFEPGRNFDVPSIPSALMPAMTPADQLYCTSCHADDEDGSRGPHGSQFAPILRERYETRDGTPESFDSYALCYRCHERESILADRSFRPATARTTASGGGHRGHLAAGISCAACHDPHGIPTAAGLAPGASGDHTHLINFDLQVATPLPGAALPVFTDGGTQSGSCALVCHGVVHDPAAYP